MLNPRYVSGVNPIVGDITTTPTTTMITPAVIATDTTPKVVTLHLTLTLDSEATKNFEQASQQVRALLLAGILDAYNDDTPGIGVEIKLT